MVCALQVLYDVGLRFRALSRCRAGSPLAGGGPRFWFTGQSEGVGMFTESLTEYFDIYYESLTEW